MTPKTKNEMSLVALKYGQVFSLIHTMSTPEDKPTWTPTMIGIVCAMSVIAVIILSLVALKMHRKSKEQVVKFPTCIVPDF